MFYLGKSLFYSMPGLRQIQKAADCRPFDAADASHDKTQLLIGLVGEFWRDWLRKM